MTRKRDVEPGLKGEIAKMKKAIILVGILLVLLFLALVAAPFLVDLNSYKPRLLAYLKPYVNRTVDFDRIELSILTGLGADLEGLRISDNPSFSSEEFLTLKRLKIRCRLLPLLRKRVEVRGILVSEPTVRIIRNDQGSFNFQDLTPPSVESASSKAQPSSGLQALSGFVMEDLEVKGGTVIFTDRLSGTGEPPLTIEQLDLKVEGLSLDQPVSVLLSAALFGQRKKNFEFDGRVGPLGSEPKIDTVPIQARVSLEALPLDRLVGLSHARLPFHVVDGNLSVSVTANGSKKTGLTAQGEISAQGLVLEETEGDKAQTGKLNFGLEHKIGIVWPTSQLTVESLSVSLNGNRIEMEGSGSWLEGRPTWAFRGKGVDLRPSDLIALFPMYAGDLPKDARIDGPVSLRWESSGALDSFTLSGALELDRFALEVPGLVRKDPGGPAGLSWEISKIGAQVTVKKAAVKAGELEATATGDVWLESPLRFGTVIQTNSIPLQTLGALVASLTPYELQGDVYARASARGTADDLSVTLQVNSDRAAFRIPPSASSSDSGQEEAIRGVAEGAMVEAQARKQREHLTGTADLRMRAAEVRSVRLERILGRLALRPGVAEILGVECKAFEGNIRSTGRVMLADRSWSLQPSLEGVSLAAVLDFLTSYQGLATGRFSAQALAEGRPADAEDGQSLVSAKGSFRLADGTLENFDLVGTILQSLLGMEGVAQALAGKGGEIAKHEQTRFESLDGTIDLKDHVLMVATNLRNVHTKEAVDSDATLEGRISLEERRLDLKGQVILSARHSEELARKVEALKVLLNPQKRMVLPFTLKGSLEKPIPFLDTQYVASAMAKYYGRQGLEKLGKELGLPKKQEGERPVEKLLKDLLKK